MGEENIKDKQTYNAAKSVLSQSTGGLKMRRGKVQNVSWGKEIFTHSAGSPSRR
jgi:hypothetical protein